jgi:hypothetical protein
MSLQRRLRKLESQLDTTKETVDRLMDRMQARAELNMRPELEAAVERANEAARAGDLPEKELPPLSDAAQQLAEVDTPDQAAADQKRFEQLVKMGVIDGNAWRARNGGLVPDPGPILAEARRKREEQQQSDAGGDDDGCDQAEADLE